MLLVDDAETLPLFFHFNSEPWFNLEAYTDPSNEAQFRELSADSLAVALPAASNSSNLFQLFAQRASCRQFAPCELLALLQLSQLLTAAYGITKIISSPSGAPACARPAPSAGGLYPLEIYVAVQNVETLTDGIYRYNALYHVLEQIVAASLMPQIGSMLLEQHFLDDANAIFFIVANFAMTLKKYGSRGYRYLLLEAGHCAQNIGLAAAENNLGSICVGGFLDIEVNGLLALDVTREIALYCVAVGQANRVQ